MDLDVGYSFYKLWKAFMIWVCSFRLIKKVLNRYKGRFIYDRSSEVCREYWWDIRGTFIESCDSPSSKDIYMFWLPNIYAMMFFCKLTLSSVSDDCFRIASEAGYLDLFIINNTNTRLQNFNLVPLRASNNNAFPNPFKKF